MLASESSINSIKKIEHVHSVNGVLKTFSTDIEFHEDLKSPIVKKALSHWFVYQIISY